MTARLATALVERGHQVGVIAPSPSRKFFLEEGTDYPVYRIPSLRNPFRQGLRFSIFPIKYVRRVMDIQQPEIIHLMDPAAASQGALKLAKKRNLPVIVTNHLTLEFIISYLPQLKLLHPLIRWFLLYRFHSLYNKCAMVTAPTATIKDILGLDKLRVPVEVISNGVDLGRFSGGTRNSRWRKKFCIPADRPVILYLGRLDKEKNLGTLITAFALVSKTTKAHLVLVGNGNRREEWQELAKSLDVDQDITWITRIDNTSPDFSQVYFEADIFCIPSRAESESMVTLEAMAAELPILASDIGALPELVQPGQNGYLLSPDHPERWAEKILYLCRHPQERNRMGEASQKRVASRGLPETIDRFENLYRLCLTNPVFANPKKS